MFVSDGTVMLTLWQAEDPATAIPFDRRRGIGLHHLALQVESEAALSELHAALSAARGRSYRVWPRAARRRAPASHDVANTR